MSKQNFMSNLINPLREMEWDSEDPIITATIDLVDRINDVQRCHNRFACACGGHRGHAHR